MKNISIPNTSYEIDADVYEGSKTHVLLFLYGYSSSRINQTELATAISDQTNATIIIPEYAGHGTSSYSLDEVSPAFHFLEVITVFDWIIKTYPSAKISVMGSSYGGFLATQLTKYRKFDKLVLRASAIYRPSDFYTICSDLDRDWTRDVFRKDVEALAKHPLLARASDFKGKTLVVVHENDDVVPAETTNAFIKAFSAEVYIAKGFPHALSDPTTPKEKFPEYQKAISDWLIKS